MFIDVLSLFILFYTNLNLTALQQQANAATLFKTGRYTDTHLLHLVFTWSAVHKTCQLCYSKAPLLKSLFGLYFYIKVPAAYKT